ncbi:MAG: cobalamin B12-binding domain-containing protein [Armatimonadetes bacterium]|nr:cobalamin B12-binding domain-containing protein [Armatimonadota bacterium]
MKVLIINTNCERSPYTLMPLGACSVASAARAAGHEVPFLDLTFARSPEKTTARAVTEYKPDVVGLSVRNIDSCDYVQPRFYLPGVRKIIQACRGAGADVIVLGGPAVTIAPAESLRFLDGDYAVAGDGERAFPLLLESLQSGAGADNIPGVLSRRNGAITAAPPVSPHDLASIPDPTPEDWLDLPRFVRSGAAMPVWTKRGCLFDCSYCLYPAIDGGRVRLRDLLSVASDVERAGRLGFRIAEFVDSVFNVPEKHAITCCEEIAGLSLPVQLQTLELNPLGCSRDLIRAMNAAGFSAVGCTAESGSERMLASLNKGFTMTELIRAAGELRKLNALKLWIFMLGGPGETESTVAETARFMGEFLMPSDLAYVACGIRILPGTELHRRAIAEGVVSPSDTLLEPAFYFSPHISVERAMSIIAGSAFPSSNIISLSDGNSKFLPIAQRAAHLLRVPAPYWRLAPFWNRVRSLCFGGRASGRRRIC